MNQDTKQFNEAVRKLFHVVYFSFLLCSAAATILGLIVGQIHFFLISIYFALSAMALNVIGEKHSDLRRIERGTSLADSQEYLETDLQGEIESVLMQAQQDDIDWVERDRLRKQLEKLLERGPHLFYLYRKEIEILHPVLAGKLQQK